MATDIVSILLKLEQVRQFVSGADRASKAIKGVGDESEQAGKKAGVSWKGLAKWAGGAAALYGATKFVRSSVDATEDLAKSTLALSRTTGMDVETASAWASVAKSRGLATKQLQVGFVKLSKEMEKSRLGTVKEATSMRELNAEYRTTRTEGGKKAPAALAKLQNAMNRAHETGQKARATLAGLGVSQRALARGNTNQVLNQVADGLAKVENPARRAALAQQLFGRGGQALLPILMKGRKGIAEQLAVVRKYGATLGVKTVDQLKDLIGNQREMTIAMQGAKVQLGTALLPILLLVTKAIVTLTRFLAPLTKNTTLLKIAVFALAAAFLAYKIAMLAATIATTFFNVSAGLTAGIVLAIVAAIAILAIGFYLLYTRVGWFRAAVDATWKAVKIAFAAMIDAFKAVWSWVKHNWPLLLGILTGPFGLAAVLIIRHLDKVKAILQKIIDMVKTVGRTLKNLPGVGGALSLAGRARKLLPFAEGGRVPYSGPHLVGERGPEIVSMRAGSVVTPVAAGAGRSLEIVVPLYLDSRIVARGVARVTADKLARR